MTSAVTLVTDVLPVQDVWLHWLVITNLLISNDKRSIAVGVTSDPTMLQNAMMLRVASECSPSYVLEACTRKTLWMSVKVL